MKKIIRKALLFILFCLLIAMVAIALERTFTPRVVQVIGETTNRISDREARIRALIETEEAKTVLRTWAEKKYIEEQRQELAEMEKLVNAKEVSF
ncbi:MAG: hypothetical protein VW270_02110 [Candidatus Poseidoniales archaeon]|jgi:hypothetical protein